MMRTVPVMARSALMGTPTPWMQVVGKVERRAGKRHVDGRRHVGFDEIVQNIEVRHAGGFHAEAAEGGEQALDVVGLGAVVDQGVGCEDRPHEGQATVKPAILTCAFSSSVASAATASPAAAPPARAAGEVTSGRKHLRAALATARRTAGTHVRPNAPATAVRGAGESSRRHPRVQHPRAGSRVAGCVLGGTAQSTKPRTHVRTKHDFFLF